MSRRRLDPSPASCPARVQRVRCPTCNAQPYEPCRSKQKVRKSHHLGRVRLAVEQLMIDARANLSARAEKKRYP